MIKVTITGRNAVVSAMNARIDNLNQKAANAIQGAGINTEAYAKQDCPVDKGRLRSSISYKPVSRHRCTVGTNVKYALPVEKGHVTRNPNVFVAGRPFLFPGYARAGRELKNELHAV